MSHATLDPFLLAADLLNPQQSDWDIQQGLRPWREIRRPSQCPPTSPRDWYFWLVLAGRGFGKTRMAAEWMLDEMTAFPRYWFAMVGATFDEGRDIMVQGESGLLACADARKIRYTWNKQLGQFNIKGGAQCDLFTAQKPDGVRGPNLRACWLDEPASFAYGMEVWNTLQFAMRKGNVRVLATGTPKATPFIKFLIQQADVVTKGKTEENRANLSEKFYSRVILPYVGTRLGRQELEAELLEDVDGALWKQLQIDEDRVWSIPTSKVYDDGMWQDVADLVKILTSIDPSVTSRPNRNLMTGKAQRASDEVGIVSAALGDDGDVYVLADHSGIMTADEWANTALRLYDKYEMDEIIAEVNNGGDLVENTLRGVCRAQRRQMPPYRKIRASHGKTVRAAPVSALYDSHKVHHVGVLAGLEDEMTGWIPNAPGARSPNRVDALVYAVSRLLLERSGRKLGYTIS